MSLSCASCTFLNPLSATVCEICMQSLLTIREATTTAEDSSESATESAAESVVDNNKRNFESIQTTCATAISDRPPIEEGNIISTMETDTSITLSCPQCTFSNAITATVCSVCEYALDDQYPVPNPVDLVLKTANNTTTNNESDDSSSSTSEVMQDGLIPLLENALVQQPHQQGQQHQHQHKKHRLQGSASVSVSASVTVSASFRLCSAHTPHITQQGVQEGIYSCLHMSCSAAWHFSVLVL